MEIHFLWRFFMGAPARNSRKWWFPARAGHEEGSLMGL
jgi:hypothetical protein